MCKSFVEAEQTLNGRDSRKIGNNTYLRRRGTSIAVVLHASDVVTYRPDGSVVLDNGGWFTATSKDRLTNFSPWLVYQEARVWHVRLPGGDVEFERGMRITKDGKVAR